MDASRWPLKCNVFLSALSLWCKHQKRSTVIGKATKTARHLALLDMNNNIVKYPFYDMHIPDFTLDSCQIDLWQFSLNPYNPEAIKVLSADEIQRAKRFYFQKHHNRFVMARASMRYILGHYLKQPPQQIHFEYTQHGKPSVNNTLDLRFNLSHSKEYALLAVGKKYELGIDIEYFSTRPYRGIAEQLFSPSEITQLDRLITPMQPFYFFYIWSQKEAFIKACGLGLSYPTRLFDVSSIQNEKLVEDPLHKKIWQIKAFMPHPACCAALCFGKEITMLRRFVAHDNFSTYDIR
jgi:4'-phosphopantetheinyl transferase